MPGGKVSFAVYLLASGPAGTLYCGMTDDLAHRVWQHKQKLLKGFTAKYGVDQLVWYEPHETREAAFTRERQIKEWRRAWKIELIERENPRWRDLYETLAREPARRAWVPAFAGMSGEGAEG